MPTLSLIHKRADHKVNKNNDHVSIETPNSQQLAIDLNKLDSKKTEFAKPLAILGKESNELLDKNLTTMIDCTGDIKINKIIKASDSKFYIMTSKRCKRRSLGNISLNVFKYSKKCSDCLRRSITRISHLSSCYLLQRRKTKKIS